MFSKNDPSNNTECEKNTVHTKKSEDLFNYVKRVGFFFLFLQILGMGLQVLTPGPFSNILTINLKSK